MNGVLAQDNQAGPAASLATMFRDSCLDDCARLAQALATQDRPGAIHNCHRLFGSALMMRSEPLAGQAGALEQQLREGLGWESAVQQCQRLCQTVSRL